MIEFSKGFLSNLEIMNKSPYFIIWWSMYKSSDTQEINHEYVEQSINKTKE